MSEIYSISSLVKLLLMSFLCFSFVFRLVSRAGWPEFYRLVNLSICRVTFWSKYSRCSLPRIGRERLDPVQWHRKPMQKVTYPKIVYCVHSWYSNSPSPSSRSTWSSCFLNFQNTHIVIKHSYQTLSSFVD